MKNAFKFIFKAFFGGCFGCLGVISLFLVLILVIGLVFGPSLMGGLTNFLQSIPGILSKGVSGMGSVMEGSAPFSGPIPTMEVYLTDGDDPSADQVTTFSSDQYEQIKFWVRAPEGTAIAFTLLMTMPDRSQVQFGPEFQTDPSGQPVSCGQFGDQAPSSGDYKLEVMLPGMSTSAAAVEFTITD